MNTDLMKVMKYLFLFLFGGLVYYGIEMLYRGHSHYTMIVLGGMCFILIGLINEIFPWSMPIEYQILFGDLIILLLEFTFGCILNLWLKLNIWDYSRLPFNVLGQVCLGFALLWIPLTALAIFVDDYIRYKLFREEKPRYTSIFLRK